jgi:hypothetical protein
MSVAEDGPRDAAEAGRGTDYPRPLDEAVARHSKAAERGRQASFADASVLFRNLLEARDLRLEAAHAFQRVLNGVLETPNPRGIFPRITPVATL